MAVNREGLLELFRSNPDAAIALFEKQSMKMDEQSARIIGQDARIAELEAQVAELKVLLGQNSRNSGRPPSTDVFVGPKSRRRKGERSVGGQFGHMGCTLRQVEVPDIIIDHKVVVCDTCGASLTLVAASDVERRQVFEIPPLKIVVPEHRAETKLCPCCHSFSRAGFPLDVLHPVQYGRYLKAFVVYLLVFQFVPYDRAALVKAFEGRPFIPQNIYQGRRDAEAE
jgi:transposase